MSFVETSPAARPSSVVLRPDPACPRAFHEWTWTWPRRFAALAVLATGFVLLGGGNLDPNLDESRLGLAAFESMGPLGQVFGGWDPLIWPGQLAPALVWTWGEGGTPTSASLRWPAAIAGVWIGLILARRVANTVDGRTGVLTGLCWFGSLALIDRSGAAGIDLITALGTVGALDRLLGKGSDLVAGVWTALAFLAGGWPPVAIVLLATIVLGRSGATLSWRLLTPVGIAMAAWSMWAWNAAPAEAWAAALTFPLTEKPAWWLVPGVLALGLPWSPLAALVASRSVREGLPKHGRSLIIAWIQVAGVCLLAGTVVPGLATAARVPALAGLAIAAAVGCDRLLSGELSARASGRWAFGWPVVMLVLWTGLMIGAGGYLASAVPYYRSVAVSLIILAVPTTALAVWSAARRDARGAFWSVALLAIFLKLAYLGYYVPEWNYRQSQGPWGRAVGQWVPPRWPIYTIHSWNHDFAFATKHPFYQIASPQHLAFQPGEARYTLLFESEFAHWPEQAPALIKVAEFQDEFGATRVLARTPGPLPWSLPAEPTPPRSPAQRSPEAIPEDQETQRSEGKGQRIEAENSVAMASRPEPASTCGADDSDGGGCAIQTFRQAPDTVHSAVLSALDDLRIQSIKQFSDGGSFVFEGVTSNNQRASIILQPEGKGTRLSARIGHFGDQVRSLALMDRIGIRLDNLPLAAIPANPPSDPGKQPWFSRSAISDVEMIKDQAEAPYRRTALPDNKPYQADSQDFP